MAPDPTPPGRVGMMPDTGEDEPDREIWRLEERALNAWPALQTFHAEGWLLRFAEGYSKRANSACALPGARPLAAVLPVIEEQYRRHGLPCCLRLTPLAPAGSLAFVEARGWRSLDETVIQVAPRPVPTAPVDGLALEVRPDARWIDGYAGASARPDLKRDTLARMLAAIATPAAFATLRAGEEPVAYGMAVLDRGAVGLFDIATCEAERGRGHARRLVAGLLGWAAAQGAASAYLQVTCSNEPALALYRRFGFRDAYRYVYAVPG
jgi:ribosomal protein S18 acetylase RimI-like enzyme